MNLWKMVGGLLLGVAFLVPAPVSAQLGTGDLRGKVMDPQGAVLPGVTVVATNEASGQYRETISSTDGTFSMIALTPGIVRADGDVVGLQEIPARRRARRGRQGVRDRHQPAARRRRGVDHGHGGNAARRHLVEADRRRRHLAGAERHPVDQPQLHDLPRHAARRDGVHLHRLVRRGFDPHQRPGHAERQLHARRRRQQRHLQRRQRRRAGAHAGRSGAGVPAPDQPVRRRVRRLVRRRRQCGVEVGHQRVPRRAVLLQCEPGHDGAELFRGQAESRRSRRPSRSSSAATSAVRSSRTSCTSSPTSSASTRTAASP